MHGRVGGDLVHQVVGKGAEVGGQGTRAQAVQDLRIVNKFQVSSFKFLLGINPIFTVTLIVHHQKNTEKYTMTAT